MAIAATNQGIVGETERQNSSDPASATLMTRREELGQFFTPALVADFMASLVNLRPAEIDFLDAGAGCGALSETFIRRVCSLDRKPARVTITAYESDSSVIGRLLGTLDTCRQRCEHAGIAFSASALNEDFIAAAVPMVREDLFTPPRPRFNLALVNPPYRKIRGDSSARLLLRSAGIETGNLYTAFVALIARLLAPGGELVAITPRSFCNGPYFKPFRTEFLKSMSLRRLHVFESRSAAFSGDDVLQENVIVQAIKGEPKPDRVIISSSSGEPGGPVTEHGVAYSDVITPADSESFIHLLVDPGHAEARSVMGSLPATLTELGLTASTGRVVDFRAEAFLRQEPGANTVPLIYPCHFNGGYIHWPKENSRKPNAILSTEETRDLLVPTGVYVLVKRFTSKEERRRVVACIYDPERLPDPKPPLIGFENHLNYFHVRGGGMPMLLARGLTAFLNSTVLDVYFRQFSGHTQVNATDLRTLRYPAREALDRLGGKVEDPGVTQAELDREVEGELFCG